MGFISDYCIRFVTMCVYACNTIHLWDGILKELESLHICFFAYPNTELAVKVSELKDAKNVNECNLTKEAF